MEVLDNISRLLGDDLKGSLRPGAKVRIAASSFSIYAFEALKRELEAVEALEFIFTKPTFVPQDATDKVAKAPREFHIPQADGERGIYGSEFEIRLKNKLTQRAIARECAEWIRRKAQFRSNLSGAPMQQFACVEAADASTVYMPLHGFTAVDLGYQQGNAVSNFVNKMDEPVAIYDTEVSGGGGKLKQRDRELSLRSLMTVNLLKRLESSVAAFRLTLGKLQRFHLSTLARIENFRRTGQGGSFSDPSIAFDDAEPDEDVDFLDPEDGPEAQTPGKIVIELADMDLPSWERDLKADLGRIEGLLEEMEKVSPADDAKLQHLKEQILAKIEAPINPGNRKVLLFTAFADTADYLYQHLAPMLQQRHNLHTARVVGSDRPKSTLGRRMDFQDLLTLFSPVSKEKALLLPDERSEIDLLIATDCISEGQNLQDCDYLINYDIHWNPVRIIQRFGRIDRIGSKNASIQLVNYWPDISLDEYIRLKERVESRMVIADVSATGDDNPLDGRSNDLAYRKEQLRRLQEEVIELEDLKTGVSITDLGLNDFRMDLVNYVKEQGDLSRYPTGMHAVLPAETDRGLVPGVIFALRNRNHAINIQQLNRLHPYYLIYIDMDGRTVVPYTEVKRLLDLIRAAAKPCAEPILSAYQPFNERTQDGREMGVYSNLLTAAIHSIVSTDEEKELDGLFSGQKSSIATGPAAGIDDFELIAFLVVEPSGAEA